MTPISKGEKMFTFRKIFIVLVGAGLLLAACSSKNSNEVKITLTEFGIKSSVTEFEAGVPYHFIVTNEGTVEHEIMIMAPFTEDQMGAAMDMEELDKTALAMIEADELAPGATAYLDYTFAASAPEGTLEFACHTPGHYEAGMNMPIIVK